MKKYLLILAVCLGLSCKKENEIKDITKYNWALESATISPAIMVDGKSETDYMRKSGSSACLNHNYTLIFNTNGSYAFTSNGPLCDMISYEKATWTKKENEIILNDGFPHLMIYSPPVYHISGNKITHEYTYRENGTNYTVNYIFIPKAK